jgi:hypothetical protein
MLFDTKTPSPQLALRAIVYHLLPLSIFTAGYVCDPSLRVWSSTEEGHLALVLMFDMFMLCTLLSLVAFVRASEESVKSMTLIFPLLVADIVLSISLYISVMAGG